MQCILAMIDEMKKGHFDVSCVSKHSRYIAMSLSAGPGFHVDASMHQELPPWEWTSGRELDKLAFSAK